MSPSAEPPEILSLGEPLIEMVRLPDPIEGRPAYVQGFGGDTSTAMIAAARQGGRTGYLSAVGTDMFGQAMMDLWGREGVDASHVVRRDGDPTGVCFIDPDPAARQFTYARRGSAASLYGPDDLPEDAIARAKIFHTSGISMGVSETMRAATFRAADIAKANGVQIALDLNYRPALWPKDIALPTITRMAERADIVFPSDDEAKMLFGISGPDAIADHFLDMGAGVVAVKQGAKGVRLATPEIRTDIPAAPATPVDSAGAGDSFAGAFMARFLETGDPEKAAREAVVVAAGTVSGYGAVEPIPRRA